MISLLILSFTLPLQADDLRDPVNQGYIDRVSNAYGFCIGQALATRQVGERYPDLKPAADRAMTLLRARTGDVCAEPRPVLTRILGEERASDLRSSLIDRILPQVTPRSRTEATGFIEELEHRSEWEFPSPTRETLLAIAFQDNPAGGMRDGHIQRFTGARQPKMRGAEVSLELPQSWREQEGDRPHIVRKWTSRNGTGLANIMLGIFEDDGGLPADWARGATRTAPTFMVPDGAELLDYGAFALEGLTGLRLRVLNSTPRLDVTIHQVMEQYMLAPGGGNVLVLYCNVGSPEDDPERLKAKFDRIEPVCRQVVNSTVLPARY